MEAAAAAATPGDDDNSDLEVDFERQKTKFATTDRSVDRRSEKLGNSPGMMFDL